MFSKYFEDWKVRSEYSKEFVSLWSGWLGKENYHKLDEVTENEWSRFNKWISYLAKNFSVMAVDCETQSIAKINDIETILSTFNESKNKDDSLFTKLVLPELNCVISEEWDYTYIIWHKNDGAVEALSPSIKKFELGHFNDKST